MKWAPAKGGRKKDIANGLGRELYHGGMRRLLYDRLMNGQGPNNNAAVKKQIYQTAYRLTLWTGQACRTTHQSYLEASSLNSGTGIARVGEMGRKWPYGRGNVARGVAVLVSLSRLVGSRRAWGRGRRDKEGEGGRGREYGRERKVRRLNWASPKEGKECFGPVCLLTKLPYSRSPPSLFSLSLSPNPFPRFMAQVATMGPPLSPRETRRSGRRSVPSGSTSASKSPDSPSSESAPRLPTVNRSSSSASSRKRTKQEDLDDPPDDSHKTGSNGTPNGVPPLQQNGNGRTKRKGKEKEKPVLNLAIDSIIAEGEQADIVLEVSGDPDAEEEEQGVTRCVCGNAGIPPSLLWSFILPYDTKPSPGTNFSSRTRSLGIPTLMGSGTAMVADSTAEAQIIPPLRTPVPDRVPAPTSVTHSHISVIHSSRMHLLTCVLSVHR